MISIFFKKFSNNKENIPAPGLPRKFMKFSGRQKSSWIFKREPGKVQIQK